MARKLRHGLHANGTWPRSMRRSFRIMSLLIALLNLECIYRDF